MVPDKRPKKGEKKKEERRRRERGLKRPMETSKNDKNVPVLPIPFPIDPNSGLLFCPHISSIPIGRENFSPPILSFVSHTTTIILLPIPRCVLFLFRLAFSLSPPSLFFFRLAFSLSPPFFLLPFFSNLSARCVYTTLDTTQSIEKLFSSHNLPHPCSPRPSPTPRWRAARCRISVTLFRALISHYISPVYVERNTESPDIQVTRRFPFFFLFFFSSSAIFITPAPSTLSDSLTVVYIYIYRVRINL